MYDGVLPTLRLPCAFDAQCRRPLLAVLVSQCSTDEELQVRFACSLHVRSFQPGNEPLRMGLTVYERK